MSNWYLLKKRASKYEKICYNNSLTFSDPKSKSDITCVEVVWNPDRREYASLMKDFEQARGFIFPSGDFLIWEGLWDAHWGIKKALAKQGYNMSSAIPIQAWPEGIQVTDTSKGTEHHHSPDLEKIIRQHPKVKKVLPKDFDVQYYDEAIVGNWSELEKNAQKNVSLHDIYDDNELNDETEALYHWATDDVLAKDNFVVKMATPEQLKKLKTHTSDMTVFEAFRQFATEEQKQYVNRLVQNFDNDKIIVLANDTVLDGNHQLIAAIIANQPQKYIDIYES